jgi:RHS repeat-associated protein
VGNRLTKTDSLTGLTTYAYDAGDRLTNETNGNNITSYEYDKNGNTLSQFKNASDQITYTWDYENRLKATNIVTSTGTKQTTYRYDANGIRVGQTVDGVETGYLIDANRPYAQVLEEYNSSGVQASYVYGNSLISQSRSGIKSFYLQDVHSGVRKLTNSLGVITDSYNYDAYGTLINSTGTTVNSYLYRGEQLDKGLNQYYLRDRYYGTDIGRFTQSDRFDGDMMNPLSLNRYGYTHGNPINGTDPSGMFLLELALRETLEKQLQAQQVAAVGTAYIISASQVSELYQASQIQFEYSLSNHIPDEGEIRKRKIKIPILVWGLDYGVTSIHTDKALHGQSYTSPINVSVSSKMNYFKGGRENRKEGAWYNKFAPCKYGTAGDRLVCDEFPYASTSQGGQSNYLFGGVSLSLVPQAEQSWDKSQPRGQGGALDLFYQGAFNNKDKSIFLVFSNLNIINSYYLVLEGDKVKVGDVSSTLYTNHSKQNFESEYNRLNKYP